jgi:hypothetical protein
MVFGWMKIVFAVGPGHPVSDGMLNYGAVIRGDVYLNLHLPGVVRTVLDEALSAGWQPSDPGRAEFDGWALLDPVLARLHAAESVDTVRSRPARRADIPVSSGCIPVVLADARRSPAHLITTTVPATSSIGCLGSHDASIACQVAAAAEMPVMMPARSIRGVGVDCPVHRSASRRTVRSRRGR